ncbi:MAG: sugar transferase, partial [Bdellovibrio sp.]|nr:sugar transferase [Bdellovibrio sp.]
AFKYQIRIGIFGTQKDIQYLAKSVRGYEAENFVHFSLVENNFCVNSYDIYAYSENSQHSDEQDYQLIQLIFHHAPLIDIRDIAEEFDSHVNLERTHISDVLTWARKLPFSVQFYIRTKLIVEPIVATSLAILLAPIMLLTALLVRISGKGPILFKQQRLGLSGREFTIYKFRTMRPDAELAGAQWAQKQDPRITRVGALLRNLHLDELPQLWNIIVGDISFVGPRPERPEFYHQLKSEIPLFYLRTIIRPGVTGWAQVFAGYGRSVEGSKVKLAYDLHYIKCMSFRMDMICLILTFVHIINKFFWGEMALHEVPTPAKAQKLIFRSTLFIFVLIAVFTLSLSAIAFAKH